VSTVIFIHRMKLSTIILAPLFTTSYVSAHGLLRWISIQGKVFEGNTAGRPTYPSAIRQVSSQDPNKGANNPALTCGPNSGPAALVANANPSDVITFDWRTASDGSVCPKSHFGSISVVADRRIFLLLTVAS
jgi:hypothetical protein